MTSPARLVGVELGGTKSIAVLAEDARIVDTVTIATSDPNSTLSALRACIEQWHEAAPVAALGIASFGPLQLDPRVAGFGQILATPKPGWSDAPVAAALRAGLDCPMAIDTDVNGAALAEYRWGAGRDCNVLAYVTIGTGVGVGLLTDGRPLHGAMHPEAGHLRLRRAPDDAFRGACTFHGDCVEGLVSGPALATRFGADGADIPDAHPAWEHVAHDIAELCAALLLTTSARRILFGGSVATARAFLLPRVRALLVTRYGAYLPFLDAEAAAEIIQPAGLGAQAGPLGAIALAQSALAAVPA